MISCNRNFSSIVVDGKDRAPIDQCFGPLALKTRTLPNRRSRFTPLEYGYTLQFHLDELGKASVRGWMEPEARRYPLAP